MIATETTIEQAMSETIQHLEAQLAQAGTQEEKMATKLALARSLRFSDLQRAIRLAGEAASLASGPEMDQAAAGGLRLQGELLIQWGDYDQALKVLGEALDVCQRLEDRRGVVELHTLLGKVHLYHYSFVNALQYTLNGLELARALEDKRLEGRLFNNLGSIYLVREEATRALSYLLRASKDAEDSGDPRSLGDALDKICLVYCGLNNPGSALNAGLRGLNIFRENGDRDGEAAVLNSLGQAYQKMKDYPRALECYSDALSTARAISLRYEETLALLRIAAVYTEQELPGQALEPLHEALNLAEAIKTRGQLVECHQALSAAYRQANQFQRALVHYENFHEIKENVFNDEAETKLKNLEVVYQVEEARREAEQEQMKNIVLQQEIDERIQAQRALQAANVQLQQEIAIREQLIGDLNAFARMVAHDLKTPLQSQAILTHLLEASLKDIQANGTVLDLVRQLQEIGQKQGTIIQELLILAGLRSQEVEPVALDMGRVLGEVRKRVNYILEDAGAEVLQPSTWPAALGHAPWVEEVWANYLTNAVKYGGSPPVIQLGASEEEGGMVRFWVHDNGDGISPEDQVRLFHDFSRLDHARAEGHGLGLSIVRRIVEKLGGQVGVDSRGRPGEGSRFWFTLRAG